ncbi:MAG: hypothetical protein JXB23_06435 [Candidatus Aminicenantes bacterium]|nr:hypothetical protein [Candidatus Aminicenantes bacterium]
MKKRGSITRLIMLVSSLFLLSSLARSQVVVGQYEDEAPVRTWNNLGILTAPAAAMGETRFALARDSSVSLSNPALLTRLPKFTVTLNGSLNRTSFFRYSLVNTGAVSTSENITLQVYSWDYAGLSYSFKGWSIALNLALTEYYYRPEIFARFTFEGQTYQTLWFEQEGTLQTINFSLARKINDRLAFGLGFNIISGSTDKSVEDKDLFPQVTISDAVRHDFSGFYLNGGIVFDATESLVLAAVFRAPYTKKSESESARRFLSPEVSLASDAAAEGAYEQPLVIGLGAHCKITRELSLASDLSFFNWRHYAARSFEEDLRRDFKNVLKIGAGLEYRTSFRLFSKDVRMPLRIGFTYDPQPVREPDVHYVYIALGTGMHMGRFSVDVAALIGRESGSGNDLSAQKFVLSVSYRQ